MSRTEGVHLPRIPWVYTHVVSCRGGWGSKRMRLSPWFSLLTHLCTNSPLARPMHAWRVPETYVLTLQRARCVQNYGGDRSLSQATLHTCKCNVNTQPYIYTSSSTSLLLHPSLPLSLLFPLSSVALHVKTYLIPCSAMLPCTMTCSTKKADCWVIGTLLSSLVPSTLQNITG